MPISFQYALVGTNSYLLLAFPLQFISGILAALSAMISLEIPQVNIMTKMDLLSKKAKKEIEKWVQGSLSPGLSVWDDPSAHRDRSQGASVFPHVVFSPL